MNRRLPADRHPSTWLDYSSLNERPLPDRRDPGYDDPRPLDWRELLDPWLWLAAVAVLVGLVAFLGLVIAVVPGPGQ